MYVFMYVLLRLMCTRIRHNNTYILNTHTHTLSIMLFLSYIMYLLFTVQHLITEKGGRTTKFLNSFLPLLEHWNLYLNQVLEKSKIILILFVWVVEGIQMYMFLLITLISF